MRRPTKVIAGLALIAAMTGGWWALRAPAIENRAALALPDPDIDPAATHARREAAIALAKMPADPRSRALALPASGPNRAVEAEHCGLEDGPQFRAPLAQDGMLEQTRAPTVRYMNAQARIDAALRSSPDPLDRAVADLINVGDMRSAPGRDEAVVQQAVSTTDPRLYALGYGLCHSNRPVAPSCRSISLERWTQLDDGNGIPWVEMLAQAQARGDKAGIQRATSHLASATRFDIYLQDAAGAVASRMTEDDQDLAAVDDLAFRAFSEAATLPIPPFQPLIQVCRNHAAGDQQIAQQCIAISDAMYAHSDNLISVAISGALLLQTTGDASRRDAFRAERVAFAAHGSPKPGPPQCQSVRDAMHMMLRQAQIGEVQAMREAARSPAVP